MKVRDIMHTRIITVKQDDRLSEVARIIFNIGVSGVPVVEHNKLIGIVTEEDLLRAMFPTLEEVIQDGGAKRTFKEMEERLSDILTDKVSSVMNTRVTTVSPDADIMRAESIMLLNKFSRIPVVDKNNSLIGIISQGDIFKYLVRQELPHIEQAKYATFIGDNYSDMVSWSKRFSHELPALLRLFNEHGVRNVVDLGSWTGEYAIELAKNGLSVLGTDSNDLMIDSAQEKRAKLSESQKKKIAFKLVDYGRLSKDIDKTYDAVVCMGNSLPYIPVEPLDLFKHIYKIIRKEGVFIGQVLNFSKILHHENRLLSFNINPRDSDKGESMSIEFINESDSRWVDHNIALFDSDNNNWLFNGITTIKVQHLTMKDIYGGLTKAGFKDVKFYGSMGEYQGEYGKLTFDMPYDDKFHDWLNVVAIK